jgi:hypothetical protein
MWDQLREWRKPAAQKRQERITAYVDGALTPRDRAQFERELAEDAALRAEVAQLQAFKSALRAVPPRRVPRNFTLDPATAGRPESAGLTPFFPVLRVATTLTAFLFVFAIAMSFFSSFAGGATETAMDSEVAVMQEAAEMDTGAAENVAGADVTADESAAPEMMEAAPMPEEAPMAEAAPMEEPAEEMAMETEPEIVAPEATFMLEEAEEDGEMAEDAAAEAAVVEDVPAEAAAETEAEEEAVVEESEGAADTAVTPPTPSPAPTAPPATEEAAAEIAEAEVAATAPSGERTTETTADAAEEAPIVPTAAPVTAPSPASAASPLTLLQVGLGALLLLLAVLTFLARRQI